MKKREKNLITLLVSIPIICIALILLGAAFQIATIVGKIILTIIIIVVVVKICITIYALYKTYIGKK